MDIYISLYLYYLALSLYDLYIYIHIFIDISIIYTCTYIYTYLSVYITIYITSLSLCDVYIYIPFGLYYLTLSVGPTYIHIYIY